MPTAAILPTHTPVLFNQAVLETAKLLRSGGVAAVPSETVYGLAADAMNPTAVAQVFAIKGRPLLDPLIVHVPDLAGLAQVAEPDARLDQLAALWPGPLTVVLRRKPVVPDLVTDAWTLVEVPMSGESPVPIELVGPGEVLLTRLQVVK